MKTLIISFIVLLLALPLNLLGSVKVVTSTSDLAYFAKKVGGNLVEVSSIASPSADLHFVEVRPSYMVKTGDAGLILKIGLELDMWMDRIIDGSRNNKAKIVDCSKYIKPLEVPSFKADASYSDLHRFGNPHYWLTPENIAPITQAIAEGLSEVDPRNATIFGQNRERYLAELNSQITSIKDMASSLKGIEIITYHNSWPYFAEYFGIKLAGFIEKYPGVAPSPSHMAEIIDLIKGHQIKVIAMEPYFDRRVPEKITMATGAGVVTLYPSIGGRHENESYIDWLCGNIEALLQAEK